MWLDNLKELKKKAGMSSKQIAEKTNLPERTVTRIFAGEAEHDRILVENEMLKSKNAALTMEIELLKKDLQYTDEIIALHNYYNKLKPNN